MFLLVNQTGSQRTVKVGKWLKLLFVKAAVGKVLVHDDKRKIL